MTACRTNGAGEWKRKCVTHPFVEHFSPQTTPNTWWIDYHQTTLHYPGQPLLQPLTPISLKSLLLTSMPHAEDGSLVPPLVVCFSRGSHYYRYLSSFWIFVIDWSGSLLASPRSSSCNVKPYALPEFLNSSVLHAKRFNPSRWSSFILCSICLESCISPILSSSLRCCLRFQSHHQICFVCLPAPPSFLCVLPTFWLSKRFGSHIRPRPNCASSAYLPPAWCLPTAAQFLLSLFQSGSKTPKARQSSTKHHPTS